MTRPHCVQFSLVAAALAVSEHCCTQRCVWLSWCYSIL